MTLEELRRLHGSTLQLTLNGEDALAEIYYPSEDDTPQFKWPTPLGRWEEVLILPLSDDDVASFSLNQNDVIFSTIELDSSDGRRRIS